MPEGTLDWHCFVRFKEYGVALAASDACGAKTRRLWSHGGTVEVPNAEWQRSRAALPYFDAKNAKGFDAKVAKALGESLRLPSLC